MARHIRIILTIGCALLLLGAVGWVVLGFDSWWLLPLILGGSATLVGLMLWLIDWGQRGHQRGMFMILGWGSVVVGSTELLWGLFRIPETEMVVDVVFAVAAGACVAALGVLWLRHARIMRRTGSTGESESRFRATL